MKWKVLVAVLACLALLVVGGYCDFWLLTVGGLVEIINGIKANPTSTGDIVWGLIKMGCSGVGLVVALLVGSAIVAWAAQKPRRRSRRRA